MSLFTDWTGESLRAAWVKRRVEDPEATVPDEFFGARREPGPVRFIDAPADNLTVLGVAGPWARRLPHFRLDSTPSNGDEIQSEYFVDRRDGAAALEAVRRLAGQVTPLLMVSEIRSTAPDELWLSGSYGRATMAIHFTWRNRPAEVDAVLRHVEAARAVRRPPALGQGLPRHRGPGGGTVPAAGRRARPLRAARPRRPVQQPPAGAARRPRAPLTARYQLARASVRVMRSSTSCGSRSGGRWSRPGTIRNSQPGIRSAACRFDSTSGG